ncbi:MAG: hypothetical protein ACD_79C01334G0002 [uncultured bacterium]|nr:MAG: hypothetical protein ACD_79C01334G0002 [uncultured bacterium]
MTTLNISLPNTMRKFIDHRLKKDGFSTASEYIRQLIRKAQKETQEEELEFLLLKGTESGESSPMTSEDWKNIRNTVKNRISKKAK